MKNRLTYLALAALTLAAAACSSDDGTLAGDTTPHDGEKVTVPLAISFSGTWSTDDDNATRVAPPEQGDTNGDGIIDDNDLIGGKEELEEINTVRIVVFRRKDPQVTGQEATDFVYDPTNNLKTTCSWNNEKNMKIANATLTKLYSYEYRVVAIAYNADEENWFSLNNNDLEDVTFEEFEVEMKGTKDVGEFNVKVDEGEYGKLFTPQFFYGYCHIADSDDPIIKYGETEDEATAPLTGRLYRAVAKVEVRLTVQKHNILSVDKDIEEAALFINNMFIKSGMKSYDDFLNPFKSYKDVSGSDMNVIAYEKNVPSEGETLILSAYVLQTKAKMGLAIYFEHGVKYRREGWFNPKNISYSDGATGVISPDANNDEFYFRRNHKYVIKGTTDQANVKN